MISWDYPDERVIAWVLVRGENSEQQRIPWLRDPRTPEELIEQRRSAGDPRG
jgi:hypothetical protein